MRQAPVLGFKEHIKAHHCAGLLHLVTKSAQLLYEQSDFAGAVQIRIGMQNQIHHELLYETKKGRGQLGSPAIDDDYYVDGTTLAHSLREDEFLTEIFERFLIAAGYGTSVVADDAASRLVQQTRAYVKD